MSAPAPSSTAGVALYIGGPAALALIAVLAAYVRSRRKGGDK